MRDHSLRTFNYSQPPSWRIYPVKSSDWSAYILLRIFAHFLFDSSPAASESINESITNMKKELSKNCRRIIVASMGMILISTGTGLVSCAASTDPAAFGRKAQTEVKKGMTKDQVREILGTPLAVSSYNGEENWHYQKNNMLKIIGTETNNVVVRFNTNGRVKGTSNSGVATAY